MKGMDAAELNMVLNFIQEHHKFALWKSDEEAAKTKSHYIYMDDNMAQYGMCIKYVDTSYDTRDGKVWRIVLRGMGNDYAFSCNHFGIINPKPEYFRYESLFEWVMAYLRCEWTNRNILKDCELKKQ